MFKSNYFQTAGPKDIECSLPTQDGPEINFMHRWIQPLTSRSWYLKVVALKSVLGFYPLSCSLAFNELGNPSAASSFY